MSPKYSQILSAGGKAISTGISPVIRRRESGFIAISVHIANPESRECAMNEVPRHSDCLTWLCGVDGGELAR